MKKMQVVLVLLVFVGLAYGQQEKGKRPRYVELASRPVDRDRVVNFQAGECQAKLTEDVHDCRVEFKDSKTGTVNWEGGLSLRAGWMTIIPRPESGELPILSDCGNHVYCGKPLPLSAKQCQPQAEKVEVKVPVSVPTLPSEQKVIHEGAVRIEGTIKHEHSGTVYLEQKPSPSRSPAAPSACRFFWMSCKVGIPVFVGLLGGGGYGIYRATQRREKVILVGDIASRPFAQPPSTGFSFSFGGRR